MNPREDTEALFRNILFATNFSPVSQSAFPYAVAIARVFGSTLHLVHVISKDSYAHLTPEERDLVVGQMKAGAEERLQKLLASSQLRDIPHEIVLEHGDLWPVLSSLVEKRNIDLIVAGSHGRHGLQKLFSGSAAEEIARLASCPVLVVGPEVSVSPEAEGKVTSILHATDCAKSSEPAMKYAFSLAKAYGACLYLLHVIDDPWKEPRSTQISGEEFFRLRLRENGWPEKEAGVEPELLVEFGSREKAILETAEKRNVQLIILNVPATTHPDLAAHLPGPLAYNVTSHARCPVLGVRGIVEPSSGQH